MCIRDRTKGGSRDVSGRVLAKVFGMKPPYNIPYGFFLVEGAKMSSSKGIGSTAREMAEFLSPEMLRYLMLATPPKRAINFSPSENFMVKMYNDFDSLRHSAFDEKNEHDMQRELFFITEPQVKEDYYLPGFSLVKTLVQLPHIDIFKIAAENKGSELTALEISRLQNRIDSAKYWLDNYATVEEKFEIQQTLPLNITENLTVENLMFIHEFRNALDGVEWDEKALQQQVFDISRLVPTNPKESFRAVYRLLLDKDKGPQVGSLLFYLDKQFIRQRFNDVDLNVSELRQQLVTTPDDFRAMLEKEGSKIKGIRIEEHAEENSPIKEFTISLNDGHVMRRRLRGLDDAACAALIAPFEQA